MFYSFLKHFNYFLSAVCNLRELKYIEGNKKFTTDINNYKITFVLQNLSFKIK